MKRKSFFDYAILGVAGFNLSCGMYAYDSQNPGATGLTVQCGSLSTTNSAVNIKSGVVVDGDVFCGVGGNTSSAIVCSGTITGSRYALTEAPELVMPEAPATLANKGTGISVSGTTTLTPANSGRYTSISIAKSAKLVISGGTVTLDLSGGMTLNNSSEIIVSDGSTLILYVAGSINSGNNSSISYAGTTLDPTHIQIYGTGPVGQGFNIKAKNNWIGIIYGPNTETWIYAGGKIYGAIVGYRISISNGTCYYYDVALQRAINIALSGDSGFTVKRWSERCDVPDWAL